MLSNNSVLSLSNKRWIKWRANKVLYRRQISKYSQHFIRIENLCYMLWGYGWKLVFFYNLCIFCHFLVNKRSCSHVSRLSRVLLSVPMRVIFTLTGCFFIAKVKLVNRLCKSPLMDLMHWRNHAAILEVKRWWNNGKRIYKCAVHRTGQWETFFWPLAEGALLKWRHVHHWSVEIYRFNNNNSWVFCLCDGELAAFKKICKPGEVKERSRYHDKSWYTTGLPFQFSHHPPDSPENVFENLEIKYW